VSQHYTQNFQTNYALRKHLNEESVDNTTRTLSFLRLLVVTARHHAVAGRVLAAHPHGGGSSLVHAHGHMATKHVLHEGSQVPAEAAAVGLVRQTTVRAVGGDHHQCLSLGGSGGWGTRAGREAWEEEAALFDDDVLVRESATDRVRLLCTPSPGLGRSSVAGGLASVDDDFRFSAERMYLLGELSGAVDEFMTTYHYFLAKADTAGVGGEGQSVEISDDRGCHSVGRLLTIVETILCYGRRDTEDETGSVTLYNHLTTTKYCISII
jgi:hypothetical protein